MSHEPEVWRFITFSSPSDEHLVVPWFLRSDSLPALRWVCSCLSRRAAGARCGHSLPRGTARGTLDLPGVATRNQWWLSVLHCFLSVKPVGCVRLCGRFSLHPTSVIVISNTQRRSASTPSSESGKAVFSRFSEQTSQEVTATEVGGLWAWGWQGWRREAR